MADGALELEHAPAAAAARVSDDARYVVARVERHLDVVLGTAIRHQAHAARGREDVEEIAIRTQRVGDLPKERNGDCLEKRVECARSLIVACAAFARLPFRAFD